MKRNTRRCLASCSPLLWPMAAEHKRGPDLRGYEDVCWGQVCSQGTAADISLSALQNLRALKGSLCLLQTATVYQENGRLMGKDYLFKVQAVEPGTSKRSTFAKCKIDMAQFCSLDGHDVREIDVKLK